MKFVYLDEAGTSQNEPVTVVAGIIVDADIQWRSAEAAINSLVSTMVPERYQPKFTFHATEIWGSPKYREGWSREERTNFLCEMMSIPRSLDLGISFAFQRRGAVPWTGWGDIPHWEIDHIMAFDYCVAKSDYFIRKYGKNEEMGFSIAEDLPKMKDLLQKVVEHSKRSYFRLKPEHLRKTRGDLATGRVWQNHDFFVERIVERVHFVKKGDSRILQIADAIAFGLRRYFAAQSQGEAFMEAILGGSLSEPEIWRDGPGSSTCLRFRGPPMLYDTLAKRGVAFDMSIIAAEERP